MRSVCKSFQLLLYYGGGRPTEQQADAMAELARAVHGFAVDQIREGGVCLCDR
jgi:hypothetical protein